MPRRCPDHDRELIRQANPTTGRREWVCPDCDRDAHARSLTNPVDPRASW